MILNDDFEIDFKKLEQYNCFINNLVKNKNYKLYVSGSSITILYIENNNKINFIYINLINE